MQNTRLNTLVDQLVDRSTRWLRNPWRRLSVVIICILLGNFLASVLATTTGQTADLDVLVALILIMVLEGINWMVYRQSLQRDRALPSPIWKEFLNGLKIGFMYGMFVQALTLGS